MEMRCHHIGYACQNIEKETAHFEKLGYRIEGKIFEDPQQKIRGLFLINNGQRIELLEPLGESSPVQGFLNKGVSMYHQGFLVPDMEKAIQELKSQGAFLFSPPVPAVAFLGAKIAFLLLRNKLMIELIEGDGALL